MDGWKGGYHGKAAHLPVDPPSPSSSVLRVCVVGAGYLGVRIAAEMLLMGVEVSVFDRDLAAHGRQRGQQALEEKVFQHILEAASHGLLTFAGLDPPIDRGRPWVPCASWGPRAPQWCATISEAIDGKHVLFEAVPDNLDIKAAVFAEAVQAASTRLLLATNTLSFTLSQVQEAVSVKLKKSGIDKKPRLVGLRFLRPVLFGSFAEAKFSAAQLRSEDRDEAMSIMARLGKSALICEVEGVADMEMKAKLEDLVSTQATLRQEGQARLRQARRQGSLAMASMTIADIFNTEGAGDMCFFCMSKPPTVTSHLCGHAALCDSCASLVESGQRRCPICCALFTRSDRGHGANSPPRPPRAPARATAIIYDANGAPPPSAAIIGAGFLGARIAAELLLLGAEVSVFDQALAGQQRETGQQILEGKVFQPISECARQGLLDLAGFEPPGKPGEMWQPCRGWGARAPRWCASVAEAVQGKSVVIESVPDNVDVKTAVFLEAARFAAPGVLLATSTVTLPLSILQSAVDQRLESGIQKPRVVGLRFLAPVVFVPFVEVTLTESQVKGRDRDDLMALLARWGKGSFICDVQGAANAGDCEEKQREQRLTLGLQRLRMDGESAAYRQKCEARLRNAYRQGPAAVANVKPAEIFEKVCCICLSEPPSVAILPCGHCCMCEGCVDIMVKSGDRNCPICRARFARVEQAPKVPIIERL